jgi:hypothetical protein
MYRVSVTRLVEQSARRVLCKVDFGTASQLCKSNPITDLDKPIGFQEAEAPRFQDNQRMNVVRFAALRTGRFYHPGIIPGTHSR